MTVDDTEYRFNDPSIVSILESFDHLMHDQESLTNKLVPKIGEKPAQALAHNVYCSAHINRESHGAILNAIRESGLTMTYMKSNVFVFKNREYYERACELRKSFTDDTDPFVNGVHIVLIKTCKQ